MPKSQSVHVFVYGTLRSGDCRHGIPSLIDVLHEEAYLKDFKMLNLGGFPGITPGEGRVRGEVHEFTGFVELDRIEGCHKNSENSLYLRKEVEVELPDGNTVRAWAYIFNGGDRLVDPEFIANGDWLNPQSEESCCGFSE